MVIILLVWTFCLLLSVLWGLATLQLPYALWGRPAQPQALPGGVPILSLVGLVVLGSIASLGTSFGLNTYDVFAAILVLSIGLLFLVRTTYPRLLRQGLRESAGWHPFAWVFIGVYGIAFLLTAAGPSEIGDEGGYHLPILVMLEQVGLVPGVGNLNHHIPLCSNWHVLTSVLGFGWISRVPGYGFYDLTGYICVVFLFYGAGFADMLLRRRAINRSDFVALVAICLPMLIIKSPISAPTNDIPAWILTWAGCLFYLDAGAKDYRQNWLVPIILLGGLVGIKITHAAMVLVPTFLLLYGLVDKRYKEVGLGIFFLALLNIPSVLRSVELSGYLLYPVLGKQNWLGLPWIEPDWWTINANNPAHYGLPVDISKTSLVWLQFWFTQYYKPLEAALMGLCALSAVFVVGKGVLQLAKRRLQPLEVVYVAVLVSFGILFFAGSPEPRYGLGFIGIGAFSLVLYTVAEIPMSRMFAQVLVGLTLLYGAQKLYKAGRQSFDASYALWPSQVHTTFNQKIAGGHVYYEPTTCVGYTNPTNRTDCDCWNVPFPCHDDTTKIPALLGNTPADGFRTRETN